MPNGIEGIDYDKMRRVLVLILGGGAGTRLHPLTAVRAKPAVPLAGKYRLVDIAISNCINSGLRKIYVLTQYLSASLNRHITQSFKFDDFSNGFVDILAAEQGPEGRNWYQGTADAVRQTWRTLEHHECDLVLILPGDALYAMNYAKMVEDHIKNDAELTIAVSTVPRERVHHFGVLALDSWRRIYDFREKPKGEGQKGIEAPASILEKFGIGGTPGDTYLASMGVYLFNRRVLDQWLMQTAHLDFGKEIIPESIKANRVLGHIYTGYWEDIGTIEAFYEAHMDMLRDDPPFDFFSTKDPLYTRSRNLPNLRIRSATIERCMIAPGARIDGATIRHSVVGLRATVHRGAVVEDSILMGADYYEAGADNPHRGACAIPIGIGEDCIVRRAIIDKNVRMGRGVKIVNERGIQNEDHGKYTIRNGIVIVPKNAVLEDGTVI